MKTLVLMLLAFVLVACANETVEVMPPVVDAPVVETPVEETPVEEPVMEAPVEEPVVEEPAPEPEPEPEPEVDEPEPDVDEPEEEEESEEPSSTLPVYNAQTLAEFDGRDGRRAYIAIDGVVYDLTGSPRWRNGNHNGFQAGQDLSRQIPQDHRADMRFERFPVVGTYE